MLERCRFHVEYDENNRVLTIVKEKRGLEENVSGWGTYLGKFNKRKLRVRPRKRFLCQAAAEVGLEGYEDTKWRRRQSVLITAENDHIPISGVMKNKRKVYLLLRLDTSTFKLKRKCRENS